MVAKKPKFLRDFKQIMKKAEPVKVKIEFPEMNIQGYWVDNYMTDKKDRKKFVLFLGIPYANPPTAKEKRFARPEKFIYNPALHGDPFLANQIDKVAPQILGDLIYSNKKGNVLDCLHLNVYVPEKPESISKPLAVMVYIHGGGYYTGNGNYFLRKPEFMMLEGVILVTVNYRLGPFGFLNMHTDKCPGNAGLKDQVLALEWVQKNIRAFRGDPGNVTIWGHGAGGSCVNFHLISPLSRGLFHKAIIQSGGIYCPWGYTGDQRKTNEQYEMYSKFLERGEKMLVEKLDDADALDILRYDWHVTGADKDPGSIYVDEGPSIEEDSADAFLPKEVEILMQEARPVPTLAGIAELDGFSVFQLGLPYNFELKWIWEDAFFKDFLRTNTQWEEETVEKHFARIRTEYFGIKILEDDKSKMKTEEILEEKSKPEDISEKSEMGTREISKGQSKMITKDLVGPGFSGKLAKGALQAGVGESDSSTELGERSFRSQRKINLARFCTDLWCHRFYDNFNFGGEPRSPSAPLFVYKFDIVNRRLTSNPCGAAHGDELCYLLPDSPKGSKLKTYQEDELKPIKTMCSLWASFSKERVPKSANHDDVVWLPHTEQNPHYLYIGNDDLVMSEGLMNEKRWNILNTIRREDEKLKALKPDPKKKNLSYIVQTTLKSLERTLSTMSLRSRTIPSVAVDPVGEGDDSRPGVSCSDALHVSEHSKGGERSTSSALDVPSTDGTDGTKRHSPSRSPTSESKTSKDESSEAKRGRADDGSTPDSLLESSIPPTMPSQDES